MTRSSIDGAISLMTKLGAQPAQAQAFIEIISNPSLITNESALIARFSQAGYELPAATALAKFLMEEKSSGNL